MEVTTSLKTNNVENKFQLSANQMLEDQHIKLDDLLLINGEYRNTMVSYLQKSIEDMSTVDLNSIKNITKDSGHYIILSDKPAPEIACKNDNFKIGDLWCWYNGTSKNIRARIKSHLLIKDVNRLTNSSSGIAVEPAPLSSLIEAWENKNPNKPFPFGYYKSANEDGSLRFLNGITLSYDANFYVAYISTNYLESVLEKIFRDEFGAPPLCQYSRR